MSELRDILADVVADRQEFTADTVKNLTTGTAFAAEIEEIADIELNTELGRDARESILLHISDRSAAAALDLNTQVQFTIRGQLITCAITRRKDNPVSLQTEFGCRKIVPGKDT